MKKIFRQKYVYNPDSPAFTSTSCKAYNCMNSETKNKRLLIIEHLVPPPFVEPSQGILQPIEIPTLSEPFSVYPLTNCVSEIGRLNEPDVLCVIKLGHVCAEMSVLKQN